MSEMPTLGEQPKKSPLPGVIAAAVIAAALIGGVSWFNGRKAAAPATPPPEAAVASSDAGMPGPLAGDAPPAAPPTAEGLPVDPLALRPAGSPAPAPAAPAAPAAPVAPVANKDGLKGFTATVNGPLESAVIGAVGKETGASLTQVVNRSLVWWLRIPQDLVKGDVLSAVYEERPGQEPVVHAVRLTSRKLGKTFEAYRYKTGTDAFARFFQPDGSELEERLVDAPLDSYEQVTSLLRDGRRHKGVDFKTPVGSPVKATFDGVIARKNWNFRSNGNCLEITESGGQGRTAMFLHLSELPKSVKPGDGVKKGEVLARSGNSGHSFAPHLHYQLLKGEKVIDPFESHKTTRRALPLTERSGLDAEIAHLRTLMPSEPLAGG